MHNSNVNSLFVTFTALHRFFGPPWYFLILDVSYSNFAIVKTGFCFAKSGMGRLTTRMTNDATLGSVFSDASASQINYFQRSIMRSGRFSLGVFYIHDTKALSNDH